MKTRASLNHDRRESTEKGIFVSCATFTSTKQQIVIRSLLNVRGKEGFRESAQRMEKHVEMFFFAPKKWQNTFFCFYFFKWKILFRSLLEG